MIEEQKHINIEIKDLVDKVTNYCNESYRLVQINCTKLKPDGFEINYSFDKDFSFVNLRILVNSSDVNVPSISKVYWNAFLYENEIHDLFGIKISDIAVDYKGNFYRMSVKHPFAKEN